MYYSPVVSPFPFIDGQNGPIYVQNGPPPPPPQPSGSQGQQQQQQQQQAVHASHQQHHLGVPAHYSYQQPQYVQVHHAPNPHFYNSGLVSILFLFLLVVCFLFDLISESLLYIPHQITIYLILPRDVQLLVINHDKCNQD